MGQRAKLIEQGRPSCMTLAGLPVETSRARLELLQVPRLN